VISDPLGDALRRIREGGLVAYPTETVWGLGADARSGAAVERLRAWKGARHPLSVLVAGAEDLAEAGLRPDRAAERLARALWPGPVTLVVACAKDVFAPGVAREDGAVGVRCSSHPLAAALVRRLRAAGGGPITSTSLNRSGAEPARTRDEARACCGDDPDGPWLLDVEGAESGGDRPSTVVDCTGPRPRVLRPGAVAVHRLEAVVGEVAS